MKLSPRYGSHLAVLLQALSKAHGPVLELGMGLYSTPILHSVCLAEHRELLSIDNSLEFYDWSQQFASRYHTVLHVPDWDAAPIGRAWDVVLVDHSPAERRPIELRRLADLADYLVVHDSNGRYEKEYHLSTVAGLFKYRIDWTALEPATTVFSNTIDLPATFWRHNLNHRMWL